MNKNEQAFPGDQMMLVGNTEQLAPVPGLSKREYAAIQICSAMISEYVKKPGEGLMEIIAKKAVQQADILFSELDKY